MADREDEGEGKTDIPPMATPVIIRAEMPEALQKKAFENLAVALSKFRIEKDIATYVKKKFDEGALLSPLCLVVN